jgi:hypothetical protein
MTTLIPLFITGRSLTLVRYLIGRPTPTEEWISRYPIESVWLFQTHQYANGARIGLRSLSSCASRFLGKRMRAVYHVSGRWSRRRGRHPLRRVQGTRRARRRTLVPRKCGNASQLCDLVSNDDPQSYSSVTDAELSRTPFPFTGQVCSAKHTRTNERNVVRPNPRRSLNLFCKIVAIVSRAWPKDRDLHRSRYAVK